MKPVPKHILILRFSSIGDIVLTTPILRAIKIKYPDCKISYMVKRNFKTIIEDHPLVDQILFYDDHKSASALLANQDFDWVVDLHKNLRTRRLKWTLKWKKYYSTFSKLNVLKWLQVRLKLKVLPKNKSIVERYFKALKPLGISYMPELALEYHVDEEWALKIEDIPFGHHAGYALAVIGGSKFTKRYPLENWKKVVELLPYPVIVIGGPEDMEMAEEITAASPKKVYNAIGKFNLQESALLTLDAKVVIANDTGFMHIAAAYQKPMVSLWGNTIPEFGMFPYYGSGSKVEHIMLEVHGLSCRPCSKIGYDACPKKHFKCMKDIAPERVVEVVKKLWKFN